MASIATLKNGTRQIWFFGSGQPRKRQFVRLGKCRPRVAETIKRHIEYLIADKLSGGAMDPETAKWVNTIDDALADRLAKLNLIPPRQLKVQVPTLNTFIDGYLATRSDIKPRTRINLNQARKALVAFFGADRRIDAMTAGEADDWRRWLTSDKRKLAKNTANRVVGRAKQLFSYAVSKQMIATSPFDHLKGVRVRGNPERFYFVTPAEAKQVLDNCHDLQWQLLFALCRYAGLRCPSECRELRWADVDFERGRMLVRSPKTEHIEGKAFRVVPIFRELRPYMEAAHAAALENATPGQPLGFVIALEPLRRNKNYNPGTTMARIIFAAGLTPWPKLFHNLRATRQTELTRLGFAEHVVCDWIGNSVAVAREHYLRVTDDDFAKAASFTTISEQGAAKSAALSDEKALQNAQQTVVAPRCPETTKASKSLPASELRRDQATSVVPGQFEKCPALDSHGSRFSQEKLPSSHPSAAVNDRSVLVRTTLTELKKIFPLDSRDCRDIGRKLFDSLQRVRKKRTIALEE